MPSGPSAKRSRRFTRRELLAGGIVVVGIGAVGAGALWELRDSIQVALHPPPPTPTPVPYPTQTPRPLAATWPWSFSPRNPVLNIVPSSPWENSAVYDPCVLLMPDGSLWMWYSTRGGTEPSSIGLAIDRTGSGDQFTRAHPDPILTPTPPEQYPYGGITRPAVVAVPGGWRMWYSTQSKPSPVGTAWIGTATSADGISWRKHGAPVLAPSAPWEGQALQCPNVRFDDATGLFQMWYCGGEQYEPDKVGFATSPDGITWTRSTSNPIYVPSSGWEDYKIGSFQVHRVGDWYYAFYNAFQRDPFVSRVGMARSRDGITAWEHHPANPLLSPGAPGSWDARMVYKPTALWNAQRSRWDVWFNASMILNSAERIGHAWSDRIW